MSGIVWLASYPKSGNTWLRLVLANLERRGEAPLSINALPSAPSPGSRLRFDHFVGYDAADLTHDEIDGIRPDLYRQWAAHTKSLLCKVHDACTALRGGELLFPPDATAGVIYVIRNPLDVCVSLAHHEGQRGYDVTISAMANPDHALAGESFPADERLRQRLLTWSGHVLSWTEVRGMAVQVVRYEDMHATPIETFGTASAFAGIPAGREAVTRAVEFSSFDELRRQEQAHGFAERSTSGVNFFRKGKVGSWREALSNAQAARIIADHGEVMRRFGYLTEAGEPVY